MSPAIATLSSGSIFEHRYEIEDELGSGSFGRVYRARQLSTGQPVALKLLSAPVGTGASAGREADRFRRETRICAALSHTNIVGLIDSGETAGGQLYAVFEYVPGETLELALAQEGALRVPEALRVMTQVLDALACAHAQGIVHRDLKPANLMLSGTGARRNALVLDFGLGGLAEGRHRQQWQTLTQSREFLGTPLYAAPEQLLGETPTVRSDLYAWGLIFLECLTGQHPFAEAGAAERLLTGGGVVAIPEWLRDHPLGALLAKVTAREPAQRDVSVESLIEALDAIAGGGALPLAPESEPAPRPLAESGERRHLTVMFCDLVGSVALSQQLSPEAYRRVVGAYQARCSEVVERYGGHVAQYLGDALLVYFGYPQAHEDDAERAVRAGREVLRELVLLNPRLEAEHGVRIAARLGLHTGPAVIGEMGSGERRETLALGDTPNVAARLQALAEPGTLLISDATRRLVSGLFATEDRGTPALKGVSERIRIHRVLEPSGLTSRLERAPALTPFVGRAQELGLLLERFEQAQEGQGQAVWIAGEAGIGKSRLVRQLREPLREQPHRWLECRSSPYTQSSAFYPVIGLLEGALGIGEDTGGEEKLERLERGLADAGVELGEAVPLFGSLLSLRLPERYPPLEVSPQVQRQKTLEALLAWLLALGEKQPLVLLVEDLHWTDPSTLEWLGLVTEQCPTAKLLLLGTFRPDFEPPWPAREHVLQLGLTRLRPREARQLVAGAAGRRTLPEELIDQLAKRSDGIPLFVEELAKGVAESGHDLSGSLADLAIPETLQDSLMARLDRLGDAKQVAQFGAALGREFPYALLEAVAPLKQAPLREGLGRLVEAELFYQRGLPPKASYTFKHALVQDTAYQSLLAGQRRELHGRIADALERDFPERVTREPEEIARHCEGAGRTAAAIAHYQRAWERTVQRFAYAEAIAQLERAIGLLRTLPASDERDRQELPLQSRLGGAFAITRGVASPEAEQAYGRARQLAERLEDAPELFRALFGLHEVHYVRADFGQAREVGQEMLRRARGSRDPEELVVAHWMVGALAYNCGEFGRAREHLEAGLECYGSIDYGSRAYRYTRVDPGIALLGNAAEVLWHLGYPEQALARVRRAQTLAQQLGDPFSQANATMFGALIHLFRGEYRVALQQCEALLALACEHGFSLHVGMGTLFRAHAVTGLGQLDEGIAVFRAVLDPMRRVRMEMGSSSTLVALAGALGGAGRAEEGLAVVADARSFVARSGERFHEAELRRVEGELRLALPAPDPARAEAAFREALEVAGRQHAKSWELRAATSLARLWQRQGRRDEARALLQPVYDWFTEGFDTADLKDARSLLEGL